MQKIRDVLENGQTSIYFATVILAGLIALFVPGTTVLEGLINPALALMLFMTFLQVPLADLGRAFTRARFFAALLIANFVMVPCLVTLLVQFLPANPLVLLGVLLVLLAPCIDYVVTFSHLGRADARLLLAATPALLMVQMLMLPFYLSLFLGSASANLIQLGPFIDAFISLIAIPLVLAGVVQFWAGRTRSGKWISTWLSLLPVPSTALVLFIVIASVVPQLGAAMDLVLRVIPVYVAFAAIAPFLGWFAGRLCNLEVPASRAVAFSASTRNSLVVLPLALAVPGALPVLPAIIVTQTLVELVSELIYVRVIPRLTRR